MKHFCESGESLTKIFVHYRNCVSGWSATSQGNTTTIYGILNEWAVFHLEEQNMENSSITWKKEDNVLNCSDDDIQKCKFLENRAVLLLKVSQEDKGTYTAEILSNQSTYTAHFLLKLAENITPMINITCLGDGRGLLSCETGRKDSVHWTLNGRLLNMTEVSLDDNGSKIMVNKSVAGSFTCHVNNSIHCSSSLEIRLNCADMDENPWSMYTLIMAASAGGALLLAIIISIITCCYCCYMKKKRHSLVHQEEDGIELASASKNNTKDSASQDGTIAEDKNLISCATKATGPALEQDEFPPPDSFPEQILMHENEEDEFPPPDSFPEQILMHENEEDEFPPPDSFLEQTQMHENDDWCQMEDELPDFSHMVENVNHGG
uniref:Uncharacterized protein LOC117359704 n=1 Tax=Geotrypetes seraphini TaxID=260995 RepID=A0A6P8QSE0_GEOSA|nr:uncharacterized protein LOC117359704 [Geotrypetes seraphini]